MSLQVFVLLSLFIVRCGGCDFDWKGVENLKVTIDSNPTGFRKVFPKDYYVVHRYTKSMLCETDPCCVFSAAVVLLDSWNMLLMNLWDEHVNHTLILELRQTLDKIIAKNENIERFLEETYLTQFPTISSPPEELLKLTSELFEQWLRIGCSPSIGSCVPPTLPPPVQKKDYSRSRARLLTTRALSDKQEGQPDKMMDVAAPSSCGCSLMVSYFVFVWSLLVFGLYW
ncbi:uncharacterized protein zgc:174888 [Austrofundulus limnaeus]|uniref:Uncharacterized protein zgc:174888 n=1 Tax=Austrofundulus limnaeus TaxID=52670 RepID=A0A2I4BK68_AUSLI|nr:PREDICTED: uncharacterized protein LOC106520528 [Austrofundulus limnaeus]